jgi:glycosyltransferase involved in cell wall biosynthesis
MRIAINTYPLVSGHKGRGIGIYTSELIMALEKYEPSNSYIQFTRISNIPNNCDLVHYPYFDPFFLTLPLVIHKPVVVTVHDLIPVVFPQHFPKGIQGTIKWQIQRFALRRKQRIIADSDHTKNDIHRIISFPKSKIDVIPLASRSLFAPAKDSEIRDKIIKKYSLPYDYVLYVGDINWNKNILNLVRSWKLLKQIKGIDPKIQLVMVGKSFLNTLLPEAKEIQSLIREEKLNDSIRCIGYVPDNDLPTLYRQAQSFIQPSIYEGFGLPLLEAMSCGVVTITSDTSSLSEIAGPSIKINPEDTSSMCEGLRQSLTMSQKEKQVQGQKALSWSKRFSWEKVAHDTVRSYEKTLDAL